MDCIPYINDLLIEINTLEKLSDISPEIANQISQKKKLVEECRINLSKLSDKSIECRLYLAILDGNSPAKAVEKIAKENYMSGVKPSDTTHIWKKYYKNLQKILKHQWNTSKQFDKINVW